MTYVSNFNFVIFFIVQYIYSIKNKPSNKLILLFHTFYYSIFFSLSLSLTLHIYYTRLSKSCVTNTDQYSFSIRITKIFAGEWEKSSRLARSIKQDRVSEKRLSTKSRRIKENTVSKKNGRNSLCAISRRKKR